MFSQIPFIDISYAQGLYNMDADPNKMIMMKASGGDGVTTPFYLDAQLTRNYANATRLGKIPFMYHVLGNNAALAESGYFLAAVSPFAKGDGYALDIEPSFKGTVQDVLTAVQHFQSVTKCYPWVYIDRSMRQAHDWSPVFALCSEWIAAPDVPFNATIPNVGVYVAQQGPIVNGHGTDMYFGSEESLRSYTYGYQAPAPPAPNPAPAPSSAPSAPPPQTNPTAAPTVTPTTTGEPVVTTSTNTGPVVVSSTTTPVKPSVIKRVTHYNKTILGFIGFLASILYSYNIAKPNVYVTAIIGLLTVTGILKIPNTPKV